MGRAVLIVYEELAGKVVLVTGAARGIGSGIARAFVEQRSVVVANDVDSDTLGAAAAEIGADAVAADVADPVAAEAMVDEVIARHGRLDVLVNNAGINRVSNMLELSHDAWERTQRVNMWGLFHCGQPAARHMVARGSGSIVVIASPAAEETYEGQTHYAASKAGLQMLAWGLAWELGQFGVRTNVVHPGWIETELNREYLWSDTGLRERVLAVIPLRRTGTVDDVARAVVWLSSDEASYVNGATLRVDGGLIVGRPKT